MSFETFINRLSESIKTKLGATQDTNAYSAALGQNYSIDSSIFKGADIDSFKEKIAQGMNLSTDDSIFYQSVNEMGIEDVFDYFDKNGDGIISDEELNETSSIDGNEEDISAYDMQVAFYSIQYNQILDDFDAQVAANKINAQEVNEKAMQDYSANIGGSDYQSYGSQTQNGSTISTEEQYTTKQSLENIEKEDIPELEEKKEKVINEAEGKIEEKNGELDGLLQENQEELGELGEKYSQKQEEINECNEKIGNFTTEKEKIESENFNLESTLSNLNGELSTIDTNTDDEEINITNTQRKHEIEEEIEKLKRQIDDNKKEIEQLEIKIQQQEKLIVIKETTLNQLQEEIAKKDPELAQKIGEIKEEITQIEAQRDKEVAQIDEEIETKKAEALKYQEEVGKRTGEAESLTGSKVVQDALNLARQELEKGVKEDTGNNDGEDIDKYRNGSANGQPWCASFVSWIYGAGQNSDNLGTFGYDASVSGIRDKAKEAGYYEEKGTYTPRPGDLMIQKNDASHVGIVTGVDEDGTIHTIEGNSANRVREKSYAPGSDGYQKISGWVNMTEWLSN